MRIRDIIERQIMFEGFEDKPYQCSKNVWTVGYGSTKWHGIQVTEFYPILPVTEPEAMTVLKARILEAIITCRRLYRLNWRVLTDPQQEVLIHMAYQLGYNRLGKFKEMKKAIDASDISWWVTEMKDSLWWDQTPRPATAMADCIRMGEWQGMWRL